MSGEADEQLDRRSQELLRSLGELKGLEQQKRDSGRSSEAFHELARKVSEKSDQVLDLALHQEAAGAEDSPIAEEREDGRPGDWTDGRS